MRSATSSLVAAQAAAHPISSEARAHHRYFQLLAHSRYSMNCSGSGLASESAKAVSSRKSIHELDGIGKCGFSAHQRSGACTRVIRRVVRHRSGRFPNAFAVSRAQFITRILGVNLFGRSIEHQTSVTIKRSVQIFRSTR